MTEGYEKLIADLEYARFMTDTSDAYTASLYARCIKAIKLLVWQLEGGGWVSVDDGLPIKEGPYLTLAYDHEMHVYYFRKFTKFSDESPVWWTPDDEREGEYHLNWVAYWRMLPEKIALPD